MPKTFHGGCLCGDVRFSVVGPLEFPHTCSCKMCQRHSGSLTQVWVEVPRERVTWTGKKKPSQWRSSKSSSRAFCKTCGSTIGAIDDKPVIALAVGTFDKPNAQVFKPRSHSFAGSRPKWWTVM